MLLYLLMMKTEEPFTEPSIITNLEEVFIHIKFLLFTHQKTVQKPLIFLLITLMFNFDICYKLLHGHSLICYLLVWEVSLRLDQWHVTTLQHSQWPRRCLLCTFNNYPILYDYLLKYFHVIGHLIKVTKNPLVIMFLSA